MRATGWLQEIVPLRPREWHDRESIYATMAEADAVHEAMLRAMLRRAPGMDQFVE